MDSEYSKKSNINIKSVNDYIDNPSTTFNMEDMLRHSNWRHWDNNGIYATNPSDYDYFTNKDFLFNVIIKICFGNLTSINTTRIGVDNKDYIVNDPDIDDNLLKSAVMHSDELSEVPYYYNSFCGLDGEEKSFIEDDRLLIYTLLKNHHLSYFTLEDFKKINLKFVRYIAQSYE